MEDRLAMPVTALNKRSCRLPARRIVQRYSWNVGPGSGTSGAESQQQGRTCGWSPCSKHTSTPANAEL